MDIFFTLLSIVVSVFLLIYIYAKIAYNYWDRKGFPHLEPKFPYGNSTSLVKVTVTFNLHTMTYYDEIKKRSWKFGGVYDIMRPLLIINDPELIGDILARVS